MSIKTEIDDRPDDRPIVVCIHGSAGNGGQWWSLRRALRGRARLYTPDLVGYGSQDFSPKGRFRLEREVDAIVEQIGDVDRPFHLIGHSYGGAVATYFAKRHPERVRSLVLYEPVNFALLFAEGLHTEAAREVRAVRASFGESAASAFARWRGARRFLSYWNGDRAWKRMKFIQRCALAGMMPKVVAEYDAMLAAHETLGAVRDLQMPVRLLCGTRTTTAAQRICELMAEQVADVRLVRLVDLAHMAPVTHPESVNPLLISYVLPSVEATAETANRRSAT